MLNAFCDLPPVVQPELEPDGETSRTPVGDIADVLRRCGMKLYARHRDGGVPCHFDRYECGPVAVTVWLADGEWRCGEMCGSANPASLQRLEAALNAALKEFV